MQTFSCGHVEFGSGQLVLIAGPCLAESLDLCRTVAEKLVSTCSKRGLPLVFKASFDKANRSSGLTPRGFGIDAGLKTLETIKSEFGTPVTTDIHLPDQAKLVASVVDILQIPAFLCRQSDILSAAAETGQAVNVKKGQFLAPSDTKNIVAKLRDFGASGIMLTERGTTFGYNNLVVDMPGLEVMRSFGVPVCFDATHSAQRPGAAGESTGGNRDSIPAMVRAAMAVGVDALFMEVHPDPANAMSDSSTQWPLDRIDVVLDQAMAIRSSLQGRIRS